MGSRVLDLLLADKHDVVALCRSDDSAATLSAKGATPFKGKVGHGHFARCTGRFLLVLSWAGAQLKDYAPVCEEAGKADAVVHTGNSQSLQRKPQLESSDTCCTWPAAFDHDFSAHEAAVEQELALCRGFVKALAGSNKPLVTTHGGLLQPVFNSCACKAGNVHCLSCRPGVPGAYKRACRRERAHHMGAARRTRKDGGHHHTGELR